MRAPCKSGFVGNLQPRPPFSLRMAESANGAVMKRPFLAIFLISLIGATAPSRAQSPVPSVERSVKALPNKGTQMVFT